MKTVPVMFASKLNLQLKQGHLNPNFKYSVRIFAFILSTDVYCLLIFKSERFLYDRLLVSMVTTLRVPDKTFMDEASIVEWTATVIRFVQRLNKLSTIMANWEGGIVI